MEKLFTLFLIVSAYGLLSSQVRAQGGENPYEPTVIGSEGETKNISRESNQGLEITIDDTLVEDTALVQVYQGVITNGVRIKRKFYSTEPNMVMRIESGELGRDKKKELNIHYDGTLVGTVVVSLIETQDDGSKDGDTQEDDTGGAEIMAAVDYIIDNDDSFFGNVKPQIWLGNRTALTGNTEKQPFHNFFDFGVTLHGYNVEGDSTNLLPALMLPGSVNFTGLYITEYSFGRHKAKVSKTQSVNENDFAIYLPLGVGAKYITNISDTLNNFLQFHVKVGFGFRLGQVGSVDINYVAGNHNTTSTSSRNFEQAFEINDTEIRYLVVNINSRIQALQSYFFIRWVNLLNESNFSTFPNERIITLGIKRDFNLKANVGSDSRPLNARERRQQEKNRSTISGRASR